MRKLLAAIAALLILVAVGSSQTQVGEDEERLDPDTYSCREHMELVRLDDGRYEVRTVWFHGFHTALHDPDLKGDVTQEALTRFEKRLEEACQDDPDQLMVDLVRGLEY
jgi:hypothetical protein